MKKTLLYFFTLLASLPLPSKAVTEEELQLFVEKAALALEQYNTVADIYVGNGGEGVRVNDQIFLRDLYEHGAHQEPFFGEKISDEINTLVDAKSIDKLRVSKNLLKRKLTDLNRIYPRLGSYLVPVIHYYRWLFLTAEFTQVPDDGSPLASYDSRIPLANRFQNVVRIHEPSWNRLTEEHKVALIIHEALFSLLKPECDKDGLCIQPSYRVRDIVGGAFFADEGSLTPLTQLQSSYFAIPQKKIIFDKNLSYEINFKTHLHDMSMSASADAMSNRLLFLKLCKYIAASKDEKYTVQFRGEPFSIEERYYLTEGNAESSYHQIYLSIRSERKVIDIDSGVTDLKDPSCPAVLEKQWRSW